MPRSTLSVAIITLNEADNLRRTLDSVRFADEIVLVDSGSTDDTIEIARSFGAKVFSEDWKGFALQKNSVIDKCGGTWVLSLDADEELTDELQAEIRNMLEADANDYAAGGRLSASVAPCVSGTVDALRGLLSRHEAEVVSSGDQFRYYSLHGASGA